MIIIPIATADLGSDSDIEPSSDIELAGSSGVDLEPANVASSGQKYLMRCAETCLKA